MRSTGQVKREESEMQGKVTECQLQLADNRRWRGLCKLREVHARQFLIPELS